MTTNKKIKDLTLYVCILMIAGCVSTSMEYRSATTAARTEKNIKKAEEWGRKAMKVPGDEQNAWIPYFLATEVYKPQKNWEAMAMMLTEAERRNPEQQLERPFVVDGTPIVSIKDGVNAHREQEWGNIYNTAVEFFQKGNNEIAKENLSLAILVNPKRGETYGTLAAIYLKEENSNEAKNIALEGIEKAPRFSMLYQILAELSTKEKDLDAAETYYNKALEHTDEPGSIMRQLIFLYIDKGEIQKAIDYSDELLNKYPNDPDIYFNIGVLFQRLALEAFDPARELYLALSETPTSGDIKEIFNQFSNSRKYAYNSRDYFLQASDLEIEGDGSSGKAAKEMRKLMKQIDEIFIPSMREIARSQNIDLN